MKSHPLTHKIEPLAYDQMGTEVTADKLKFSTPLTQPGRLNPNSCPVFSPLPDQPVARSMPTPQTQEHFQLSAAADSDHKDRIIETVCGQMALSRLPLTEPEAFDGNDLLQFPLWRTTFEALVNRGAMTAVDKLNLLTRFVKGEAKLAIQGYLLMPPDLAYERAYRLLNDRYGDNFRIAGAFKNRLKTWPKLIGTDSASLRSFVDFLRQCHTIKHSLPALRSLDDEAENAELVKKLPPWLARQWTRRVSTQRRATGEFPTFDEFVSFLEEEDLIAHDPLIRTLQKSEGVKERRTGASFASDSRPDYPNPGAGVGRSFGTCVFCGERHSLQICKKFGLQTYEERQQYIRNHRLCFGCLVRGHIARDCKNRKTCQICQGGHPTSMHIANNPPEDVLPTVPITACASNRDAKFIPQKSSMVLPVRIYHTDNPERGRVIYTMIDSQSDSSFITESTAQALGLKGAETRLSLSTMTASDKIVKCRRFQGLEVQGLNCSTKVRLPPVYSRRSIPINRQHIPCAEMVENWPHLHSLKGKLAPKLDYEVGLLIGYDCSEALFPREVISAPRASGGPFGMRTDLGWGIVGVIDKLESDNIDSVSISHRAAVKQATVPQIIMRRRSSKRQKKKKKKGQRVMK